MLDSDSHGAFRLWPEADPQPVGSRKFRWDEEDEVEFGFLGDDRALGKAADVSLDPSGRWGALCTAKGAVLLDGQARTQTPLLTGDTSARWFPAAE